MDQMQEKLIPMEPKENRRSGLMVVFIALAVLASGEIYGLMRTSAVRLSLENQQAAMRQEIEGQLASNLARIESANVQQLSALRGELDQTAERMGSAGKELNHARAMVARLQKQQQQDADTLKAEIARKADDEKVGALTQDVSTTKTDLASTKQSLDQLSKDLGMAKSDFGTLIARNHDDIETLRKLGERDYFEFTLIKNQKQSLSGVGLTLKKTNVKHNRFDLNLLADDLQIEKKGRTVNEPVFFYVSGSKKPYELVVNRIESDRVIGYLSTPKGAEELAGRTASGS